MSAVPARYGAQILSARLRNFLVSVIPSPVICNKKSEYTEGMSEPKEMTEFEKDLVAVLTKHKKIIFPFPVMLPDGRVGAELGWKELEEKPKEETKTDLQA